MPVLRWLVPLVAALGVLCGSIVTYAAAGWVGSAACCCPPKATCTCRDHDRPGSDQPTMKRCGERAELVAPAPVAITVPSGVDVAPAGRTTVVVFAAPTFYPADHSREPEKPPF